MPRKRPHDVVEDIQPKNASKRQKIPPTNQEYDSLLTDSLEKPLQYLSSRNSHSESFFESSGGSSNVSTQESTNFSSSSWSNSHNVDVPRPSYSHSSSAEYSADSDYLSERYTPSVENRSFGYFSQENSSQEDENPSTSATTAAEPTTAPYSIVSQKLMKSMGYEPGKGLGAKSTGILEPVQASQQQGRRGLGHGGLKSVDGTGIDSWDKEHENASAEETVAWMPVCVAEIPSFATLSEWVEEGPRKEEISDETTYCDPEILSGVLSGKSIFDQLGEREIQRARQRCNPYETIGKGFFLNRAAMKMANLDSITGFMFTKPVDDRGHRMVSDSDILYFADICAGPGGFSEYAIWRRKQHSNNFLDVHGFGFTLRSCNDFKLQEFLSAPREAFEPHYGKNDDGDIFNPNNIESFCSFVKSNTQGRGVHFVMGDGGFSVDGQENIQEILSKQLYLCQFTVALGCLREGGHFLCKLFDTFTAFSVGLIYLMYRCFKEVAIHKPVTSRPANSERYILCKWLRAGCEDVFNHLFDVNQHLCSLKNTDMDVVQLVPQGIIEADSEFTEYIRRLNNSIGRQQIIGLQKIAAFCNHPQLLEPRQGTLRTQCLRAWQIPDNPRVAAPKEPPVKVVQRLLSQCFTGPLKCSFRELRTPGCLSGEVSCVYNYRFVMTSVDGQQSAYNRKGRSFYLGTGYKNVFVNDTLGGGTWERLSLSVELPADTLVLAELVNEIHDMTEQSDPVRLKSEKRKQRRIQALHLIDAVVLNGFFVGGMHLVDRHRHLRRFCDSVNKNSRTDILPIRCKVLHRLEELPITLAPPRFSVQDVKASNLCRVYYRREPTDVSGFHFPVTGILLIPTMKEPYTMAFSVTRKRKYFFNKATNESSFDVFVESIADFQASLSGALLWKFRPGTSVLPGSRDESLGREFCDSDEETEVLLHIEHFKEIIKATPGIECCLQNSHR